MALDALTLNAASLFLLAFGVCWFLWRNDELPLAITGFNYLFVRRLWVVEGGLADWANFDYGVGFSFTGIPHEAATYMLLGATVLTAAYCAFVRRHVPADADSEASLKVFLLRHQWRIVAGFILFTVANVFVYPSYDELTDDIYASSYSYQFTLAHSGFIILLGVLVAFAQRGTPGRKLALLAVIAITGALSVAPSLRFSLLGWAVALAFVFTGRMRALTKLLLFAGTGTVVAFVFTLAGLLRQPEMHDVPAGELIDAGAEALFAGRDVNMLDGFTMLIQVYPEVLDYGLGREHLEILTRPIPRAIWPDKPVGGWAQKLAVASGQPFFQTGISPSLYGSFYGEGGIIGIVLLSTLYGWLFARYVNWANRHASVLRWALRGALIASLFALIRGGDLPGIAAFVGMSYWPLMLFVWRYHRALRTRTLPGRSALSNESHTAGFNL